MALTDLAIIRRSMTARAFSTVVTVFSVAAAVALLIILSSLRDAGRQSLLRGSGNMHLVISRDDSPLTAVLNNVFYARPPARPIAWAKYESIRAAQPYAFAIPTQLGDSFRGFPVMATTAEFFTHFSPDPFYQPGSSADRAWTFASGGAFAAPFEVVVGARVQRETGLRVGDTIYLTHGSPGSRQGSAGDAGHVHLDFPYKVVGVLGATGGSHDRALFTDLTSTWIIHAHDRRTRTDPTATTGAADLTDEDRLITGIYARAPTRPGSDASSALQAYYYRLRADPTIVAASPASEIQNLLKIVDGINQVLVGMAVAVMISSGVGILLALYNSMDQRRRQIAVLRVLGCSRGRIFGLVVTESALLAVLGAASGYALGLVGSSVVSALLNRAYGLVITPRPFGDWALFILVGTVLLGVLAGLVPATMAYRTAVAKNLRPIG